MTSGKFSLKYKSESYAVDNNTGGIDMSGTRYIRNKKSKKGFTLVELVVVIAILGILAAIAIPAVIGIVNSASKSADESTAHALDEACKTYYSGVRLGLINSKEKGASRQENLPGPSANLITRHKIAAEATVTNACEYAQMDDVLPKLENCSFGYNEYGTILRYEPGLTELKSDTQMKDLYGSGIVPEGSN